MGRTVFIPVQSLEQEFAEFAARIKLDELVWSLMSDDHDLARTAIEALVSGAARAAGSEITKSVGSKFSVITQSTRDKSSELVKSFLAKKIIPMLEGVDSIENLKFESTLKAAILGASKTEDEDVHENLARLVEKALRVSGEKEKLQNRIQQACLAVSNLTSEHISLLGVYFAVKVVIPIELSSYNER